MAVLKVLSINRFTQTCGLILFFNRIFGFIPFYQASCEKRSFINQIYSPFILCLHITLYIYIFITGIFKVFVYDSKDNVEKYLGYGVIVCAIIFSLLSTSLVFSNITSNWKRNLTVIYGFEKIDQDLCTMKMAPKYIKPFWIYILVLSFSIIYQNMIGVVGSFFSEDQSNFFNKPQLSAYIIHLVGEMGFLWYASLVSSICNEVRYRYEILNKILKR